MPEFELTDEKIFPGQIETKSKHAGCSDLWPTGIWWDGNYGHIYKTEPTSNIKYNETDKMGREGGRGNISDTR